MSVHHHWRALHIFATPSFLTLAYSPPSLVSLSRISPFFHQIKLFVHTDNCSIGYFLEQMV